MDEDVIDDIAAAFANQLNGLIHYGGAELRHYETAIWDDILAIACVINMHVPTYDLRYFYAKCGYPEPYPVHEVQI